MAFINKTRYAILGVLCIKPCSGYDIKKFCDKTISHFWNENFGHIYPVLKQLLEEKLIAPANSGCGDRRKIYQITDAGKQEFLEWLIQPATPQPPRSELLLKLSFGNHMPKDELFHMLDEEKLRNTSQLKQYRAMEASYQNNTEAKKDPAYPCWLASLRFGILHSETVLAWCDETIQLLKTFQVDSCSGNDGQYPE